MKLILQNICKTLGIGPTVLESNNLEDVKTSQKGQDSFKFFRATGIPRTVSLVQINFKAIISMKFQNKLIDPHK
jgi:hypothetical protein